MLIIDSLVPAPSSSVSGTPFSHAHKSKHTIDFNMRPTDSRTSRTNTRCADSMKTPPANTQTLAPHDCKINHLRFAYRDTHTRRTRALLHMFISRVHRVCLHPEESLIFIHIILIV